MRLLKTQYVPALPHIPITKSINTSLSDAVKKSYTSEHYETSVIQDYETAKNSNDTIMVAYKDLPDTVIDGFPIGSDRDKDGNLQFLFPKRMPNTHIINIGTTGSGKTTGFVEPGIRAVSMKKNKPNMFITDPKGELFARNAEHLKKQGYRIFLINFKDLLHSDCWNPLLEIYDTYIKQKGLKDKIEFIDDIKHLKDYKLQAEEKEYGSGFWAFCGKAYATQAAATRAYEDKIADILSETADLVHQLVHTLIPDTMIGTHDPSWFMGAQEILSVIIYAMLEDALDERSGFTRDNMNLMNIQEYFDSVRKEVVGLGLPLLRTKKLSHKTDRHTSIKQMRTYFENAPTTTRSYLGCFRNAMQGWFNNKIFTVCNGDTVKPDFNSDAPFAIFLITRDFEKSDFTIAGMFIDWVYKKALEAADSGSGRLKNEMFFILDEFANIPPIKDFENKIATSRSRNIWFHMFVQSYAQLQKVYDSSTAQTILDNCNTHVFMGSANYDTKSRFARECGKQAVESLDSMLNPQIHKIVEVPLLTIGKLETIKPGHMYIKRSGMPLTHSEFIRSYCCDEFTADKKTTPEELGIESLPFNSDKYRYMFLESDKNMEEYGKIKEEKQEDKKVGILPSFLNEVI